MRKQKPVPRPSATIPMQPAELALVPEDSDADRDRDDRNGRDFGDRNSRDFGDRNGRDFGGRDVDDRSGRDRDGRHRDRDDRGEGAADSIARALAPRGARRASAPPPSRPLAPRRSAGESIARLLYFVSGAALAGVVAVYGGEIWRQARHVPEPTIAPPTRSAAAVAIAAGGRLELATDRRTVTRFAGEAPRWTAPQPAALDAIELTGPLVLGDTPDAVAAIDLESGRTRFTWALPGEERWAPHRPVALGSCLIAVTTRDGKLTVRCLDLATGAVRWTAAPAGAHDCAAPEAVPGGYLLPCPGWTAILDDRTGAVGVEAGGMGLVGTAAGDPPYLLRARSRLSLAPWSATKHRFTSTGEIVYGAGPAAISSAVVYKDRLVLRAVESSDELAIIQPRTGAPSSIAAAVYRLADATPLTGSCGQATAPRYQLLDLAPRIGASFDPATAGDRALALLDIETGTLAWTSRKVTGLRSQGAAGPRICRGGHYFVPLEVPGRTGAASALWIVDAQTGKTAAAVAFDADMDAGFAKLTADQIDDDRVVGIGRQGPFELRWQPPGHGLHDARRELEDALGPLP